jgi:sec-independent protein translocase protein TatC
MSIYLQFLIKKEKTLMSDKIKEMSFLDHLEELRWRLVKSAAAVLVFGIIAFLYKDFLFDKIILGPKQNDFITYRFFCKLSDFLNLGETLCMQNNFTLQNVDVAGQFNSHLMISIYTGIILAFPFVFYQLWKFISPALKENEKKMANSLLFFVTLLFAFGLLFGYFIVAPLSIQFFGSYQVSSQVENNFALSSYVSNITSCTFYAGLIFQLPVAIYFLAKLGLVSTEFLRKYRKHAYIGILILAAIVTPPDVYSQTLVSLPLFLLYEISIFVSKRISKKNNLQNNYVQISN